jgi:hypothetical protein
MRTRRPKEQKIDLSSTSFGQPGSKARRSLARSTHQQVFVAIAGITPPAGRSVKRTDARGRAATPPASGDLRNLPRTSICPSPLHAPSPPSGPGHALSPALLLFLLQQQLDALSDE